MTSPLALTITVTATLYRRAERAIVTIRIHSEGSSQQEVSKDVTERSNELRTMLKEMALKESSGSASPEHSITHWSVKTFSTGSHIPGNREGDKLPREYIARTTFGVRFRDFAELGSFASIISTVENVSVQKIRWELTDATKAGLGTKSRIEAIKHTMHQAKDYSEALGRGDVTATEVIGGQTGINEAPYYGGHGHGHGGYRGGAGVVAGGEELNFEPENVSFTCSVTLKCKAT